MPRRFFSRRTRAGDGAPLLIQSQTDPEAFVELYDELYAQTLRFFLRRTFDPEAAFDLTAETFARAYAHRMAFRGSTDEEMYAWLWTIARRQLSSWYEKGYGEREMLSRLGLEPRQLTDPEIERVEELVDLRASRAAINAALESLPSAQQQAVRLRVFEHLAYGVIAKRLQVSEQAARARVSRGLGALRRIIDLDDDSAASP